MASQFTKFMLLAIIAISTLMTDVSAVGEAFKELARQLKESMLLPSGSQSRRMDNNQKEVNILIESHLQSVVDSTRFERNMGEMENLIKSGEEHYEKIRRSRGITLTKEHQKPHNVLLMETLQKLVDLNYIKKHGYRCDFRSTFLLSRANNIAMDPISRRTHKKTDLWPRIDNMVFEVALERAKKCLRECKANLIQMTVSPSSEAILLQDYWKRVLDRRLKAVVTGDVRFETAFANKPSTMELFVDRLPHATVEEDELDIGRKIFKGQADATADEFNQFLTKSCQGYLPQVLDIFETFDFDAQLQRSIPGTVVFSDDVEFMTNNVHRIYMKMCKKLVREMSPSFLPLLEIGVNLPLDGDPK